MIKAVDGVLQVQQRAKNVVSFFNHSIIATERLSDVEHKLVQDMATHWNSTYLMFERIVQQNDAVTTALCLSGRNYLCLTNEEINTIKTAVAVLKPFFLATEEMSTEKTLECQR